LLAAKLLQSNIDGAAGAIEEGGTHWRANPSRWPKTRVMLRGDSGFACEALMA
jgi:hypothetical protein